MNGGCCGVRGGKEVEAKLAKLPGPRAFRFVSIFEFWLIAMLSNPNNQQPHSISPQPKCLTNVKRTNPLPLALAAHMLVLPLPQELCTTSAPSVVSRSASTRVSLSGVKNVVTESFTNNERSGMLSSPFPEPPNK